MIVADYKFQIIPDSMIVTAIIGIGLLLTSQSIGIYTLIHLGMAFGIMFFFYLLWLLTHGRGIGFGDVKLSFVLGLLLGFPEAIIALYIAFLTGAMVGVILIARGRKTLKSKIAFGPFLIGATGVVFVFHTQLLHLWSIYL
jgi:leader peptidase (prepilin peptidase)/N-methyltransferase